MKTISGRCTHNFTEKGNKENSKNRDSSNVFPNVSEIICEGCKFALVSWEMHNRRRSSADSRGGRRVPAEKNSDHQVIPMVREIIISET